MPTRTRASHVSSIDEVETNWAAAAAAVVAVAPAAPSMHDELVTQEEEEEWVNTGVDDEDEDEDEELIISHESVENERRSTWILKVEIPENATNGDGGYLGLASVYIDPGMTAELLGRCIIQAVFSTSTFSRDYNDDITSNYRSRLVGLFGKDDRVFYSLEFILAMEPLDGAKLTFCVTKPVRHKVATPNRTDDVDMSMIFSYITIENLTVVIAVLFLAIFVVPIVVDRFDDWNQFIYSLLLLVPQDLPSMWRIVSFILDWPARELYRYGPSLVGWEGRDLIDICTQMNRRYYFVGLGRDGHNYEDREYWLHNPEACETIYRMKEESFARMCRPLWYLIVLVVSFIAIRRCADALFSKPPGPQLNRIDRAVLDTYRSLHMLAREHRRLDDRNQRQQMAGR